jgi:hypothetical protein
VWQLVLLSSLLTHGCIACVGNLALPLPFLPQEQLLDVLRALSSPNLDIRRKTLDIALDLITSRNIDEVCEAVLIMLSQGGPCRVLAACLQDTA